MYGRGILALLPIDEMMQCMGGGEMSKVLNRAFFGGVRDLLSLSDSHHEWLMPACKTVGEPLLDLFYE